MSGPIGAKGPMPQGSSSLEAMKAIQAEETQDATLERTAENISSRDALAASQEATVNPFARALSRVVKDIKARGKGIQKMLKSKETGSVLLPIKQIEEKAGKFNQNNRELNPKDLVDLRKLIKPGDTKAQILEKLAQYFSDVSLADEALDFLLETTEGELAATVKEAKDDFNLEHGREIKAGRNILKAAQDAAYKDLGTATSLRDMYREITGNPRDSTTLFQEFSSKYAFKELKTVIDFMLHSLGADLKSGGPSISPGLLHRLISEVKNMQAILGVYRYFRGKMKLVDKMMSANEMPVPKELSFESMAKQFMGLAALHSPSPEAVLAAAKKLGVSGSLVGEIIVLSQMRDAVREVNPELVFKSQGHKNELYNACILALENLEDQLEDYLAEQENQQIKKDKLDLGEDSETEGPR